MSFRAILDHLSYDMGVPLVLDSQGQCKMLFNKALEFYLGMHQNEERFHIYAHVCELSEQASREALYASLLKAHAFGHASGGAVFGISDQTHQVLLFKEFNAHNVDYHDFLVALEKFVQALGYWKDHISKLLENTLEEVLHQSAHINTAQDVSAGQTANMEFGMFKI